MQYTLSALLLLSPLFTAAHKLVPGSPVETVNTEPAGGKDSDLLTFPGDWSRNVLPIPVHSHNDYWRDVPLLTAMSYGVRSIEADVWLNPNDKVLYVGHEPQALTRARTFSSLYVQPLLKTLEQANNGNANYTGDFPQTFASDAKFFRDLQQSVSSNTSTKWTGFFSLGVGASAPIQLLVDVKTDGNETWPHVVKELEPLRKMGWLTRYDHGKIVPGPVLVIGTGNTPVNQLAPYPTRDVFIDGPLGKLDTPFQINGTSYDWNSTLCPIASVDFSSIAPGFLGLDAASDEVRKNLSTPIQQAHEKGIETRYWDTPEWPSYARDRVNSLLLSLGSDWINADDLGAIAKY